MKRTQYWWYLFIIVLFFLDICAFSLLEHNIFFIIPCAYIVQLFQPFNHLRLTFLLLLICLESLLRYGIFGIQLIAVLPISLVAVASQRVFYNQEAQKYIFLTLLLGANSLLVEYYWFDLPFSIPYTTIKIIVNLILLWFFSFEIGIWQGKQGNRS